MFEIIESTLRLKIFWITVIIIFIFYLYFKYVIYSYWKKYNIPHDEPTPPFGNVVNRKLIFQKRSLGNQLKISYEKYKKFPFHGLYMFHNPVLMVTDLELIRQILVKDFSHFLDRGIQINTEYDPLSNHLFFQNGDNWRLMRNKVSPTFTTIKLKTMFSLIIEITNEMVSIMNEKLVNSNIVEIKELLTRFTIDAIFSLAFGINSNCIRNPDNEFRRYGDMAVKISPLRSTLIFFAPSVLKTLKIGINKPPITRFFLQLFKDMIEKRRISNEKRTDFMNLLIELMDHGEIDKDEKKITSTENTENMNLLEAAAQAFVFFIAGYETTSSTITHCLHELALNPDIQEKLQEEIDNVTQNLNDLTYDKIAQLEYLDMVLNETIRKHPSVPLLNRICIKDWKIPGSEYTIPKGMALIISVSGIHRDSNIYPDPDKFDPMRFSKENNAARHTYAFLPFGEGPRACVGKRLGIMQSKIALVSLLLNYRFSVCDKTPISNVYSTTSLLQIPENIHLRVEKRKIK